MAARGREYVVILIKLPPRQHRAEILHHDLVRPRNSIRVGKLGTIVDHTHIKTNSGCNSCDLGAHVPCPKNDDAREPIDMLDERAGILVNLRGPSGFAADRRGRSR